MLARYTNIQFHDSQGEALIPVEQALFGRARKAKDRIHWLFPPDKVRKTSVDISTVLLTALTRMNVWNLY